MRTSRDYSRSRQLYLASVAVDMVTAIHRDNAQRFFFSFFGHDRPVALGATWGKFPKKGRSLAIGCPKLEVF